MADEHSRIYLKPDSVLPTQLTSGVDLQDPTQLAHITIFVQKKAGDVIRWVKDMINMKRCCISNRSSASKVCVFELAVQQVVGKRLVITLREMFVPAGRTIGFLYVHRVLVPMVRKCCRRALHISHISHPPNRVSYLFLNKYSNMSNLSGIL